MRLPRLLIIILFEQRNITELDTMRYYAILETVISEVLQKCAIDDALWDEDYITLSLYRALKEFFDGRNSQTYAEQKSIVLNIYKNKGKTEYNYGDVAILVRRFIKDTPIDGIGFCEAKREYAGGILGALDFSQLERMNEKVANHKLLIYSRYRQSHSDAKLNRLCPAFMDEYFYQFGSIANTLPSINAVKLKTNKTSELLGDSIPFSYQMLCKYLEGFDLVYNKSTLNDIVNGEGSSRFLVTATYAYPSSAEDRIIKVDRDKWEEIL